MAAELQWLGITSGPLDHLRSAPYTFWPDKFSFGANSSTWVTVLAMIFIIPAAHAHARFEFKGTALTLSLFLAANMFAITFNQSSDYMPLPADGMALTRQKLPALAWEARMRIATCGMGLVLHYSQHVRDLKKALDAGQIGPIAPYHGAFFMRDWRRKNRVFRRFYA